MLYSFIVKLVHMLIILINGTISVLGKEKLPKDDNYIIIAPHRSILDPVFIAIAILPKQATYMAKKELFENKLLNWILIKVNAFPVNRQKPGPSALKTPVKRLKETDLSLVIFPSGTRHSKELKGGALTIARLSKKPIVPAYYNGPLTIKGLFKRKKTQVLFGEPFYVEKHIEDVEDLNQYYLNKINQAFYELEKESNQKNT